jgi:hypothetical protein
MLKYHLGKNNRPFGGHSSETWSHPIEMIIISWRAPSVLVVL